MDLRDARAEIARLRACMGAFPHAPHCESMKRANTPMELCTCFKRECLYGDGEERDDH